MSMPSFNVGILGATGAVGQTFIRLLEDHPWFTVTALAASERSAGKPYREAANWLSGKRMPDAVAELEVTTTEPSEMDCDFVFSGLSSSVAGDVEKAFAEAGFPVISNAKNYRMQEDVPLLIPEVNADHARLVENQDWGSDGFIVTNPNCSTVGLVCALRPLVDAFGVEKVQVTMLQALSGAGYPGVSSLDALGNVIPYIGGEEDKLATEPRKILGQLENGEIRPADMVVSAQCNRVPVRQGHLACISVACTEPVNVTDVTDALESYRSPLTSEDLPSVPDAFLRVMDEVDAPQPLRHVKNGNGMTVSIGRIQECPVNHVKFVALSHNTIRGAAGGAVLNAELLARDGYLSA
ncbi:aspartate-semialdehyde dehydrogenase [Longibacter salinarum]|uniref:Aspartate-semialdehyde dehydrogenase n=1 Tax=Longibacter salinarum TaxID=1850348 RepID=A0A2A8CW37_9BACT|nr:aspartate-semialdehyde dehydrogenase [Longibacter salinarum]PEN12804.1 aspartate-semialdehyde dehydrogenase [Longibacter salinarum]